MHSVLVDALDGRIDLHVHHLSRVSVRSQDQAGTEAEAERVQRFSSSAQGWQLQDRQARQ